MMVVEGIMPMEMMGMGMDGQALAIGPGGPMGLGPGGPVALGPGGPVALGPGGMEMGMMLPGCPGGMPPKVDIEKLPFTSIGHRAMWKAISQQVQSEMEQNLRNPAINR